MIVNSERQTGQLGEPPIHLSMHGLHAAIRWQHGVTSTSCARGYAQQMEQRQTDMIALTASRRASMGLPNRVNLLSGFVTRSITSWSFAQFAVTMHRSSFICFTDSVVLSQGFARANAWPAVTCELKGALYEDAALVGSSQSGTLS